MAFRIIKSWLMAGLRRRRSRHGKIVVSGDGEAVIRVSFEPDLIECMFTDPEPPIDPCAPHPPDSCSVDKFWCGFGRWGVKIKWDVWSVRTLKFRIEGQRR